MTVRTTDRKAKVRIVVALDADEPGKVLLLIGEPGTGGSPGRSRPPPPKRCGESERGEADRCEWS